MTPPEEWARLPFFEQDWPEIRNRLNQTSNWLPGPDLLFAALDLLPPHAVRVIILGQDPYPTPGHANGLAFSFATDIALPRSLKNIYTEMRDDIGSAPATGDLSHWARQGVLLLNTALSVPVGMAGGHAGWGWQRLAQQAIEESKKHGPLAFLIWGAHARKTVSGLPREQDLLIESAHPSPLSARRGFFGNRPFSRINDWLKAGGREPIDWVGLG